MCIFRRRTRPAARPQLLIVRVASLDGSVIFFETPGRALVLSSDGEAVRGFLGREITLDAVFGIIDCPLFRTGERSPDERL